MFLGALVLVLISFVVRILCSPFTPVRRICAYQDDHQARSGQVQERASAGTTKFRARETQSWKRWRAPKARLTDCMKGFEAAVGSNNHRQTIESCGCN